MLLYILEVTYMKYKSVFWDWNGTLLNDAAASWLAVNDMLCARNLPLITFEKYREYIDVPIIRFYERVMDVSKEDMEKLSLEFNSFCAKHLPADPLQNGAREILEALKNLGIRQHIYSSSHVKYILPVLDSLGISSYFEAVLGANDVLAGSKAERTKKYLEENGILPEDSLFVGDLVHDNEVASYIGSECVLVTLGHQPKNILLNTGSKVIDDLTELDKYFKNNSSEVEK